MASRYNRSRSDKWRIFNSNYRVLKDGTQIPYKVQYENPWYATKKNRPLVSNRDSFEDALEFCLEIEELIANSGELISAKSDIKFFRRDKFRGEFSDQIPAWHKVETVVGARFTAECGYSRSNALEDLVTSKATEPPKGNKLCYNCANGRKMDR